MPIDVWVYPTPKEGYKVGTRYKITSCILAHRIRNPVAHRLYFKVV